MDRKPSAETAQRLLDDFERTASPEYVFRDAVDGTKDIKQDYARELSAHLEALLPWLALPYGELFSNDLGHPADPVEVVRTVGDLTVKGTVYNHLAPSRAAERHLRELLTAVQVCAAHACPDKQSFAAFRSVVMGDERRKITNAGERYVSDMRAREVQSLSTSGERATARHRETTKAIQRLIEAFEAIDETNKKDTKEASWDLASLIDALNATPRPLAEIRLVCAGLPFAGLLGRDEFWTWPGRWRDLRRRINADEGNQGIAAICSLKIDIVEALRGALPRLRGAIAEGPIRAFDTQGDIAEACEHSVRWVHAQLKEGGLLHPYRTKRADKRYHIPSSVIEICKRKSERLKKRKQKTRT